MDAMDGMFSKILVYIKYFSSVFTDSSCEYFSEKDATEIIETLEVLASSAVNRSIHVAKGATAGDSKRIKNYIKKKEVRKQREARIIPEMENVSYSDGSEDSEEETPGKRNNSSQEESPISEDKLNNVTINQERLLLFTTMINGQYKEVYSKVEESLKWKNRTSYDTLLYAMAHLKLLHTLFFLSRLAGSADISIPDHYNLLLRASPPKGFTPKEYDGSQMLIDRILSEKWNAIGFLLREGLVADTDSSFARDILRHKSPWHLFQKVSGSIHLFSLPSMSTFLENGHVYDAIYLQTLPGYVQHKEFLPSLKKMVRTFISKV